MSEVWAVIVSVIILMVIYGYVSSKISNRKKKKLRENTVPKLYESLRKGEAYDVFLSDGRKFESVKVVGAVEGDDDTSSFAGYEGLLVLMQPNGKRVFLKKSCIRFVAEV